ncbi:polyketide synthase type I [Amycolatopsis balhimycina DSM 5908]|uniref:Polyketide synthase type I n=1 Tax=Amycolatopsis balhimycina DSM 5908 TaxID=1081091 RepID=A0A428WTM8_AMYBA|nr:thioester reductase domain-containing protein [Amycolatopsis balhimycina]RSM46441.1 polyketide synthase type I [Amycolatopsis balhimycina DSM 5908]
MSADTAIAVVGIGCRFPGADTPAQFWAGLEAGVLGMRELTDDELRVAGVGPEVFGDADYVRRIATLAGPGLFAAEFFGVSPAEAELIDPQQRLFLETCWEALEQAGYPPGGESDQRVGVFAGMSPSGYVAALQAARARRGGTAGLDHLSLQLGGMADFGAARVAHKLGLRGPSVGVQTACSSSLTAVHYAVLSLLSGECDLALAGGAGLAEPAAGYRFEPGGILSDDGYCRAFDARSSGTAVGSGVGVVALRRLADALADRDPVLAVLRGSAVGNDGARRPGFTAPTPDGPADVVAAALHTADVGADLLCYTEAHGSGTPLGDHVELRGLTDGLRISSAATGFCALGSVKVNIGHTGAAAGVAGLIKAVRIAATGILPPHPLFERPRDEGLLADSPFTLAAAAGRATGADRHVLVNSMGLGGTNAAVVLGAPPAPRPADGPAPAIVRLRLSARNRAELDDASARLAGELEGGTLRHADVAYTLRTGRRDFAERRVVTAPPERLAAALRLPRPGPVRTLRTGERRPLVVAADPAQPLCARLVAALGAGTEVVPVLPPVVPDDVFVLFAGESAETSADSHTLPLTGDTDALEEALATAWLHGVRVGEHQPPGDIVRVPLPAYPFPRRRYWALDDLGIEDTGAAPEASGPLQTQVLSLWRELFGISSIGPDDEFGALGGTSLLSVRMALRVQQRHGVLINLHRVGGSRATVRRVAEAVAASGTAGEAADGDGALIDADLAAGLGPIAARPSAGTDVLLTGATGYVGAFLLHELLRQTTHRVYCLVRAEDEAGGLARLAAAATRFRLPVPDLRRVVAVPGDAAGDVCRGFRDGELTRRIGHILHGAARVVFTEPYRVLRTDNVLPVLELVRWARESGITDFSQVSTLAATGPDVGTGDRRTERRAQPLDPRTGGYGASKWAAERLLERAGQDGLRVRVFRPGLISGATATGACNTRDMLFRLLAAGLAVGAHPLDPRPVPLAPVDVVAEAVVGLAGADGATGRPYHLVDRVAPTLPQLFGLLAEAGHPTEALPVTAWFERVAERALETGDPVLASIALYDLDRLDAGDDDVDCEHWQDWLRQTGRHARVDAAQLVRSLGYLAGQPEFAGLVPIAGVDVTAGENGGH